MTYWWMILVLGMAAGAHYLVVARHTGILTLDGIFVISQVIMSAATFPILDPSSDADRLYARIMLTAPLLYMLSSILIYSARISRSSIPRGTRPLVETYRPTIAIAALTVLAAAVTIAYYQVVGYNVFILGLRGMITGSSVDITTLRLNSYSDLRYLFPGYVNQFKNTILPTLALVGAIYLLRSKHAFRYPLSAALIFLSVVGLLGTGQRGAFIQFSLACLTFLYYLDRSRFKRRAVLGACVVVPTLFLTTFMLGRSSLLTNAAGPIGKLYTIAREVVRRFFYDNQWSGQMGFRYTYLRPTQNGQEWLQGILGVLPGNSGSTLPRRIFESLYGTDRGTAPPSLWGSVFYDFGWLGVIVVPVALAVIYQAITVRAITKPSVNTLELAGMCGTFVVLGNWIAGGPDYVLNAGGLTFALLWWIGSRAPHLQPVGDQATVTPRLDSTTRQRRTASLVRRRGEPANTSIDQRT